RCNSRKATTGGTRANSEPITTRGWYSGKPSSTRSVKVERDVVEGDRGPGVVLGRGDADDLLGPGERLDVGAQQSGRRRTPARSATGADPRDREDPLPAGGRPAHERGRHLRRAGARVRPRAPAGPRS